MAGAQYPKTTSVRGSGERPAVGAQGRATVVVVDDDPQVLRALGRSLEGSFDVKEYDSPEQAIDHVRRGGVSVVISDVAMPRMTGIELLRAIRNQDPDIPVILITGEPSLEGATSAIELGVFRYLRKPCRPEEVRTTAEQASRLYRLAQTKREALELAGPAGASDRVGLELTFRAALDALWIAYQPIVSLSDRSVFGYEALMRSAHGALPGPQHLLEAAERLQALDSLGRLIRERAVEPFAAAPQSTLLFINLHPKDLMDPELADPGSPLTAIADRVVLEVTERSSLGGLDDVQARVAELRKLGFRIAIDDLGAGYAGLTSFALLEPEIVKIDMTLTRGIDKSAVKQKLVSSLTGLCREMNMTIVTEGVETAAERDTLVGLGCDLLQGYLFAKPGRPFPAVSW
jgi:EAL domain-containing protein (putative c-di-GMP-specific phosphodiesterase class I)